jgi:hypothetical protein
VTCRVISDNNPFQQNNKTKVMMKAWMMKVHIFCEIVAAKTRWVVSTVQVTNSRTQSTPLSWMMPSNLFRRNSDQVAKCRVKNAINERAFSVAGEMTGAVEAMRSDVPNWTSPVPLMHDARVMTHRAQTGEQTKSQTGQGR